MGGKTGYPVSWYTNDKEEGNFMEIEATSADRNLLLEMKGELDHHGARNALRELELPIDAALPKKLVLDLAGVTFMDSSGIGVLLNRYKQMRGSRGSVAYYGAGRQVKRILSIGGIAGIVQGYDTKEAAIEGRLERREPCRRGWR